MRVDFDRRLAVARQGFDTRAAALITADPGLFGRCIRGGTPDSARWAAARQHAVAAAAGALDEDRARKELAAVVLGLGGGAQALIVEVSPEGIGVTRAATDAAGVPHFTAEQPVCSWPDLIPALSEDREQRLLQLASGFATPDSAALRDRLAAAIPALSGDEVLVICRPSGWALLETVSHACLLAPGARLLRVAAEFAEIPASGTLGTLTASMPLLRGYGVVVATVDPATGTVSPATQPLFHPGDAPGAEASVTLRRFPGDRDPATLAVAVDAAGSAEPQVVALHSVPQPDRPVYQVSARLDASGRVRFTAPPGVTEDSRSWADVRAGMPRRTDVRPTAVDLVCAVELAGQQGQVARRKAMVRKLLEELAREYPEASSPRVGLIGCLDHVYEPGEEGKRVIRGVPLGPVDDALSALEQLRGGEIRYPDAAPLEDLLHDAHQMLAGSRAAGRTGRLLLVAGRRPHPPALKVSHVPGARIVQPCPLRRDWGALVKRLGKAGTRTVVVADALPGRAARAAFWSAAGQDGLYALPAATVRAVGEDLGLLVRHAERTGLPLPA
jgi:hypothetical protein